MIYHGIDTVEIERVRAAAERFGERFLSRVFTPGELSRYAGRPHSLAARFAAKEAAAKLLGVGVRGLGGGAQAEAIGWHDVEVLSDRAGRPTIVLHGRAAARAALLGIASLAISLTHTDQYATASVVALASE